ncbi:MAG: bifunctional oligoribonuclease/PAP phosphatase NrnA [Bacteroidales bacterium]|nr:bifunctional oligoribonuclease/PAP phosphatase NrnA [Bacteroidales bacterium]
MDNITALDSLIRDASRISASVHIHPDGDALGSGLALVSYLKECRGKDAVLMVPDPVPDSLSFMLKGFREQDVLTGSDPDGIRKRIGESDLLFCLDCSSWSRSGEMMEPLLKDSSARKVLVDHHLSPDKEAFDLVFSETEISSASEVLYYILKEMPGIDGHPERLPLACRTSLLTGMTTDTNNFANSVFPSTLKMASELIASGVDRDAILHELYNCYRENRLRLMGCLLNEKLEITPEGLAFMILDKETQRRFDFKQGESEGFVNLPLAVKKVRMSMLLTEEDDRFRVSIRSKRGTSANECAMRYFSGGGHEMAAGGKLIFPKDIPVSSDAKAYILKVSREFFKG